MDVVLAHVVRIDMADDLVFDVWIDPAWPDQVSRNRVPRVVRHDRCAAFAPCGSYRRLDLAATVLDQAAGLVELLPRRIGVAGRVAKDMAASLFLERQQRYQGLMQRNTTRDFGLRLDNRGPSLIWVDMLRRQVEGFLWATSCPEQEE